MDNGAARDLAQAIFGAVVRALDPAALVRAAVTLTDDHLTVAGVSHPITPRSRVVVVGAGKAAVPMARGIETALGGSITRGLVVAKHQTPTSAATPHLVAVRYGSHPVPDASSLAAGQALLDAVRGLSPDDIVIALISGGGSALAEVPAEGIDLHDIVAATGLLLASGADIRTLNAVRQRLSRLKGGGLARAAAPARVANLVISDVIGNALPVIASGPTVPPDADEARLLDEPAVQAVWDRLPAAVRARLSLVPAPSAAPTNVVQSVVLADAAAAARAAASAAGQLGLRPVVLATDFQGEARELGAFWAAVARHARLTGEPFAPPVCLIGAGEATVTVRGDGMGGRNTEMALAAALRIAGVAGLAVASLATDGDDAGTGAAGGVVVGGTVAAARAAGIDPQGSLARNDSATALRAAGGLVVTGPTETNVNDLYLAVIP